MTVSLVVNKSLNQNNKRICYLPQRSWGKVIFSQASVILSTGGSAPRGEVCSQKGVCSGEAGSRVGGGGAWSWGCLVETPPGQLLLWAVRILLECILVVRYGFCASQNVPSLLRHPVGSSGNSDQ